MLVDGNRGQEKALALGPYLAGSVHADRHRLGRCRREQWLFMSFCWDERSSRKGRMLIEL